MKKNPPLTSIADAHKIMTDRMAELTWTAYKLAEAAKPFGVARSVVFEFAADGATRQRLNLKDYIGICLALGLRLDVVEQP